MSANDKRIKDATLRTLQLTDMTAIEAPDPDVTAYRTPIQGIVDVFPAASLTVQGKVELATVAETQAGVDAARAVTPAGLEAAIKAGLHTDQATPTVNGMIDWLSQGVINIRAYGDFGGDPVVNLAKIQAAMLDLVSGGTLWFPYGTYYVYGSVTVPDGVKIAMDHDAWFTNPVLSGGDDVKLFYSGNDCDFLLNYDGGVANDLTLHDIYPVNLADKTRVRIHHGYYKNITRLSAIGMTYSQLEFNRIKNCMYGMLNYPGTIGIRYNQFCHNEIEDALDYALVLGNIPAAADDVCYNQVNFNTIRDTQLGTTGPALGCEGASDYGQVHHNSYIGNTITQTATSGTNRSGGISPGQYSSHNIISRNQLLSLVAAINSWYGIYAQQIRDSLISENIIKGFAYGAINAHGGARNKLNYNNIYNCGGQLPGVGGIALNNGNEAAGSLTSIDIDVIGNYVGWAIGQSFTYAPSGIILLNGYDDQRIRIIGDTVENSYKYGIVGKGVTGHLIDGLTIKDDKVRNNSATEYAIDVDYTDSLRVEDNDITESTYPFRKLNSTNPKVGNNVGYVTENRGVTGAIATGATVAHGLSVTPTVVQVTPAESGPTDIYVSAVGATTFVINFGGGGNKAFYWEARYQ